MIHPPSHFCRDCGEDVSSVYDHELGCSVAIGVLERQVDHMEETIEMDGWQNTYDQETIDHARDLLEDHREAVDEPEEGSA